MFLKYNCLSYLYKLYENNHNQKKFFSNIISINNKKPDISYIYKVCKSNYKDNCKYKKILSSIIYIKELIAKKTKMNLDFLKLLKLSELQDVMDLLLNGDEAQLDLFLIILKKRLRKRYKQILLRNLQQEEIELKIRKAAGYR